MKKSTYEGIDDSSLEVLQKTNFFTTEEESTLKFSPLESWTNQNFLVTSPTKGKFVFRVPGPSTHEFINRANEKHNIAVAHKLGFTENYSYFDSTTGVLVRKYLEGHNIVENNVGAPDIASLLEMVAVLAKLHNRQQPWGPSESFQGEDSEIQIFELYKSLIIKHNGQFTTQFDRVLNALKADFLLLSNFADKSPDTNTHNDANPANFLRLQSQGQIAVIDMEYSSRGNPMWDLAYFMVHGTGGANDVEQEEQVIKAYAGDKELTVGERSEYHVFKGFGEYMLAVWLHLQVTLGSLPSSEQGVMPKEAILDWENKLLNNIEKRFEQPAYLEAKKYLQQHSK